MSRNIVPIFVVGSARSGTTMVGKLIFSKDDCFEYKAETLLMSVCRKRYGDIFNSDSKRKAFLNDWFKSRQFLRSNLIEKEFIAILKRSKSYPELLINFLSEMAIKDKKKYIVDSTPANINSIGEILKTCPEAKFVHVVRDGRDVALSQEKLGWINPPLFYQSKASKLNYTLIAWSKLNVKKKHINRKSLLTIRYEDFLSRPASELERLSEFIGTISSSFDLETVLNPTQPNSAFGRLGEGGNSSSLARWKTIEPELLQDFTFGCNKTLKNLGYTEQNSAFSIKKAIRYIIFSFHLRIKYQLTKYHFFAKRTSEMLEINKR